MDLRELREYLAGALEGEVLSSPSILNRHVQDFGGLVRRRAALVVRPASESDLSLTLAAARHHELPVSVRGSGCSVNGQSLSEGGLLINLTSLARQPPRLLDDQCVEVSTGSRWGAVEQWLNRRGRMVPVLADNLSLTVGGTLSVGGYGIDSIEHGSQVRQVRRLRLMTPDGEAAWCSRQEHAERFRYALAGQGRIGIITRAVIRTQPLRRYSVLFPRSHRGLVELAASMEGLQAPQAGGPELFKAWRARGKTTSVQGWYADTLSAAGRLPPPTGLPGPARSRRIVPWYRALRSHSVKLWVAQYGRCVRLWSDFLVDYAGLCGLARQVERLEVNGGFGGALKSVYVLANRKAPRAEERLPLDAGEAGEGPVSFGIGLYCLASPRREELIRVNDALRQCLDTALPGGGRPYLYGWHGVDADRGGDWRAELDAVRQLRDRFDPTGLFQRGKTLDRQQADAMIRSAGR